MGKGFGDVERSREVGVASISSRASTQWRPQTHSDSVP